MKMSRIARGWPVVAVLSLMALLTACRRSNQSSGERPVLITGAGSSFGYPIYSAWASDFHKSHPNVRINYQSIGSGAGIRQILTGTVDFGASDAPMTNEELSRAKVPILHFPTVLGAVVPIYNVPGVSTELKFTPKALAGIFLGKITRWDDPEIAQENPGVHLPSTSIVVIHRTDASGTSFIWTDYLSKVSPAWKAQIGVGKAVSWPVGLGGKGSEGVTGLVEQIPNSIGYVELTYAMQNHLPYGSVENSSGLFIKASLPSVTAAAAAVAKSMPSDFRVSITDAPGRGAYPISSFTWLLVPTRIPDTAKRKAIKRFLQRMLTEGQNKAEPLDYARLPGNVVVKEVEAISKIH